METIPGFEEKQQEINGFWKKHKYFYRVSGGLLLIGLGALLGGQLFLEKSFDYKLSLCTNALAIAFGILVLDQRAQKREEERLKQQLIREMSSRDNGIALRALEEFKAHADWLVDGSLHKVRLTNANLEGAKMANLDLEGAILFNANLKSANLNGVRLRGANLGSANLQHATLMKADLRNADLQSTDLQGALMQHADLESAFVENTHLEGTNLFQANLKNAKSLDTIHTDMGTRMPDNSLYSNVPGSYHFSKFSDPKHSDFWRSNNPHSPAYRDK